MRLLFVLLVALSGCALAAQPPTPAEQVLSRLDDVAAWHLDGEGDWYIVAPPYRIYAASFSGEWCECLVNGDYLSANPQEFRNITRKAVAVRRQLRHQH